MGNLFGIEITWQTVVAGALALGLGLLLWSWDSRGKQINKLNGEIAEVREALDAAHIATRRLEARIVERDQEVRAAQQLRERILNAPQENDGSVAPVLRDLLDQLRNTSPDNRPSSP